MLISTRPRASHRKGSVLAAAAPLAFALLAGCSASNEPTVAQSPLDTGASAVADAGGADAASTTLLDESCTDTQLVLGTPNDVYAPNLKKTGKQGYQVVLVSSDPAPPHHGTATWVVRVLDPAGSPVTQATVSMPNPYMPEHVHHTSVTPAVVAGTDGSYTISNIYYFMTGNWQLTVNVADRAGVKLDSVVFDFCVPT